MTTRPDESDDKHALLKHLLTSIPCAVCEHPYRPADVEIVDHRDEIWIVAVKCSHCGTTGVVFALIREEGPDRVSDLLPEEWARFRQMPQISADELLDVHEFLKDFDGDFISLFEDEAESGVKRETSNVKRET